MPAGARRPVAGRAGVMTEESARRVANVLLGVTTAAAVLYVVRTPPLRRVAVRLAATALTSTLPMWLGAEIRRAWAESSRSRL
jgi:hypothetical protein